MDSVQLSTTGATEAAARAARPAFRAVFDAEAGYVWNSLRRLGVREHDLEDLSHEVFMAVHVRLGDYDPTRPLRPWLFGIAFRAASDYRRRAHHHREVIDSEIEHADRTPGADEQLATEQARRLLLDALDTLDMDRRAVVVMHDLDGCPVPEVAGVLGIPLNTAYSRLRLGREQLAAAAQRLRAKRGAV